MVPNRCRDGKKTVGLLYYLYGPGRANEHADAHMVAAWAMGVRDPGRDPGVTMTYLAALLDAPVLSLPQSRRPEQHVYHVSVRVAPEDTEHGDALTDEQWAEVAREMMDASGMARFGDPMAVRWVAVRHAPDHIHIVATRVRQDGKRPEIVVDGQRIPATYMDGKRMQVRARQLEQRYGLRLLADADGTAPLGLTRAELEKTERAGRELPARTELGRLVRRAAAASGGEEEFFAQVRAAGLRLQVRTGRAGEATGYAVALPGDRTAAGRAVWYSGSRLAADLSLPRVRERWAGTTPTTTPTTTASSAESTTSPRMERGEVWRTAAAHVHRAAAALGQGGDTAAAGELVALSDLLTVLGADAPPLVRQQLRDTAWAFERAGRAPGARTMDSSAARDVRVATTLLVRAGRAGGGGDDAALALLLIALMLAIAAAMRWHQQRGHTVHQEAAALAGWHLRTAVELTRGAAVTTGSRPSPGWPRTGPALTPAMLRDGERILGQVLPDLSARILREEAWPTLAATLATVQNRGLDRAAVLAQAASHRGLDDARSLSEVLTWRLTRALHRTAAATIPATSPIPGGIPRRIVPPTAPPAEAPVPATASRTVSTRPAPDLPCGRGSHAPTLAAPTLAKVLRDAVPELAELVLADPAAAALERLLGRAHDAGWDAPRMLADVAETRSLDDADSVAQVLTWRLQGWLHRAPVPRDAGDVDVLEGLEHGQELQPTARPHLPDRSLGRSRGPSR